MNSTVVLPLTLAAILAVPAGWGRPGDGERQTGGQVAARPQEPQRSGFFWGWGPARPQQPAPVATPAATATPNTTRRSNNRSANSGRPNVSRKTPRPDGPYSIRESSVTGTSRATTASTTRTDAAGAARQTRPNSSGMTGLSEQQQADVEQLRSDLAAIKQGSEVTPEQKENLQESLEALMEGSRKVDLALVRKLSGGLSQAMAAGHLSGLEKAKLSAGMQKVLNSSGAPAGEVETAIADARSILTEAGVSPAAVQEVVTDLEAVAAEAKKNGSTARPSRSSDRRESTR